MNRRITDFLSFLLCLFLFVFAGCSESKSGNNDDDVDPDEPDLPGTWVCFVNSNEFPVSIYSDSARQVKITEVQAGKQSDLIAASPNPNGAHFYPTYQILIEGLSLLYDGDEIITRIDADKTTPISIHSLEELGKASPNKQLTTNSYIKIQNSGSLSLLLRKGNYEVTLEGTNFSILNGGETGMYKISPGPVSDYSLKKNTVDDVPFPADMTQFSAARIYTFNFNGYILTLQSQSALTLGEVGKISGGGDGTETYPIQLTGNTWANGNCGRRTMVQVYRDGDNPIYTRQFRHADRPVCPTGYFCWYYRRSYPIKSLWHYPQYEQNGANHRRCVLYQSMAL